MVKIEMIMRVRMHLLARTSSGLEVRRTRQVQAGPSTWRHHLQIPRVWLEQRRWAAVAGTRQVSRPLPLAFLLENWLLLRRQQPQPHHLTLALWRDYGVTHRSCRACWQQFQTGWRTGQAPMPRFHPARLYPLAALSQRAVHWQMRSARLEWWPFLGCVHTVAIMRMN